MRLLAKSRLNKNATVFVRADFNVPLDRRGQITDDTRIRLTIPTLQHLLKHECRVIIGSHLGRPESKVPSLSLKPIAKHLSTLLNQEVEFIPELDQQSLTKAKSKLNSGQVLLLENLRFDPGEEANSPTFAQNLAADCTLYVNDAFSVSHRAHASIAAITDYLPSLAGLQFAHEFSLLEHLIHQPVRPFVTVIGGAKISTKIAAVSRLITVSDIVLVGGGLANHFIKADGFDVADSYLEEDIIDEQLSAADPVSLAQRMIDLSRTERMLLHDYIPLPKILYPIDVIATKSLNRPDQSSIVPLTNACRLNQELKFVDIGPKTRKLYTQVLLQAGTIFWNGPMGVFEIEPFAQGTAKIAEAIARSTGRSIIGGGDTISAINSLNMADRFDALLASGGAALDYISGKTLPGLEPLQRKT